MSPVEGPQVRADGDEVSESIREVTGDQGESRVAGTTWWGIGETRCGKTPS